jgi:sugar lactone lactonase YvrE
LAGCASAPPKREPGVFFPPPPAPPRIQFLTSFSGLRDIEEQSGFSRFVVGENQNVKLDKPYGVAIHKGRIYVCDTNATVVVFDLERKRFQLFEGAVGKGLLLQPVNISIDRDGTKFVADPGRGQVVAYGADDSYLRAYGEPGAWRPVDAVAFADRLYVADVQNGVIKVFDRQSGEQVKLIGDRGEPAERLSRPTNLAFDREGYLYVSDIGRFQIAKFDRDGHFIGKIGDAGDSVGHFARPKGLALDRAGRIYAVDAAFNNVQVFSPQGRTLMSFGGPGERPGDLQLPAKVAIDYDNLAYFAQYVQPGFEVEYLVLVTSQFGPRLVSVLAYGRDKASRYPTDAELLRQIEEKRQQDAEKEPAKPAAEPPAVKQP